MDAIETNKTIIIHKNERHTFYRVFLFKGSVLEIKNGNKTVTTIDGKERIFNHFLFDCLVEEAIKQQLC
jgi:hypothetical protein